MSKRQGPGARYEKGETLGQGTFGVVFKAKDLETGKTVAVKKIRFGKESEGVNLTALREIKLLKELQHPNIIQMVDVFPHKQNLNLVFEFMTTDLETIIHDRNIILTPGDIKSYVQMTLTGLAYCHSKWVLHRDMKPNNLLISADGKLKLGDFGLARVFGSPDPKYTNQVFARWYRAPELLFGSRKYGSKVDMWGVGCVMAELLLRRPFLPGSSDLDQLGKIFAALGTPTDSQWPDMKCLPDFVEFNPSTAPPLKQLLPMASEDTLDILSKMFAFDPNRRISAEDALKHRYFVLGPPPTPPSQLPLPNKKKVEPISPPARVQVLSPLMKTVMAPNPEAPGGNFMDSNITGDSETDPQRASASKSGSAMDVSGSKLSTATGVTPTDPMSIDVPEDGDASRPILNSIDRKYLRKRKLDMDMEFAAQES